jgi:hypothetical protein
LWVPSILDSESAAKIRRVFLPRKPQARTYLAPCLEDSKRTGD